MKELFNKEMLKESIMRKGNLSAPSIDKLTYPILKFEKDDAADLLVNIMRTMIRLQKHLEAWKEENGNDFDTLKRRGER
jgi:hypothetical protein